MSGIGYLAPSQPNTVSTIEVNGRGYGFGMIQSTWFFFCSLSLWVCCPPEHDFEKTMRTLFSLILLYVFEDSKLDTKMSGYFG